MALIICNECQQEHSNSVKACPHCGFKRPKNVGRLGVAVALVFGFTVYTCTSVTQHDGSAVKTPAVAEDSPTEQAFQKVVTALRIVKSNAREPASIEFRKVGANFDASVICIEYSGRNGFSGISVEHAAFVNGMPSQGIDAWNRNCATTSVTDMKHAIQAL